MVQSKTMNAGPVGLKPKGDYSASATYTLLDCVKYNHDSWVCKAMNAQGEAITITGQAPAAGSQYWQALTDGGIAAYNAASSANEAATNANGKATLANDAATNANTAAGAARSAESQALAAAQGASRVNAKLVGYDLQVTDRNGNTSTKNVKGDKGEGIDYNTLTAAQKQELAAMVVRQVTSENILGPQYEASKRRIVYPTTSGVKYDEGTRSIKIL